MKTDKASNTLFSIAILILLFVLPNAGHTQIPQTVSYQGYLTDPGGNPVDTGEGTIDLQFAIYGASSEGSVLWTDMQAVTVNQGVYSVTFSGLGGLPFHPQYYLQVAVDEDSSGTIEQAEILTPRQPFTAVPYALHSDTVDGQHAGEFALSVHTHAGSDITSGIVAEVQIDPAIARDAEVTWSNLSGIPLDFADNVDNDTTYIAGTGLGLAGTVLNVDIPLTLGGSSVSGIISGVNNHTDTGYGVYGLATGSAGYGVYGLATGSAGYGVYGNANATGAVINYGGSFVAQGDFGRGVYGRTTGSSGYGVYGHATGSGTGGYFTSTSGYGLIVANGNVGIGTPSPNEKLTVDGMIESISGGIKFPDGSVQTSAIYGKVAVVAQTGGQYTSPLDAMNDIASWCGVPGKTNPCLVKIMPGIYDLGNNGLTMQSWVDIEGSGERTTTITSTHSSGSADETSATIIGDHPAEIRFITIENRGDGYCIAMFNAGRSPDITHVTAVVSGVYSNYGVYNLGSASPTMKDVNIFFSQAGNNYGVYNYSSALSYSSPTMIDITITDLGVSGINYGVYNAYSNPAMTGISINLYYGTHNYGVYNFYSSPTMTDMIITASGVVENYGIANYTSSPTMTDVTVTVSGGAESYGVYNYQISLPIMTDVKITASGDNGNDITCGMCNYGGSNLEMTDVKITASGDPESLTWGVNNEFSSPTMTDVSITASGGLLTFGIANNPSNLIIKNSSISSTAESIHNSSSYSSTVKVGATMLEGAVYGTGFTCVGAYDENFVALDTSCQ